MTKVIDGKAIAAEIRANLKKQAELLREQKGITPGLAVVLVGDDPASQVYVRLKEKACVENGFYSSVMRLDESIGEKHLLELIEQLNADKRIHGILVQLPLPKHINVQRVLEAIRPEKDVDGFHPINAGKLVLGGSCFAPCTPLGCIELIKRTGQELSGKNAVVIGRSNIVGKPLALLLLRENATVTVCHSRTQGLAETAGRADILIAAIGVPGFVREDMVKDGAIVIDVGTTKVDGVLKGDVDYDRVFHKASYITPVPGGVGPMTITMLLSNTLNGARLYG